MCACTTCIQEWEQVVLHELKWDVAAVTPVDFVDIILCQLSMMNVDGQSQRVRQHALTFVVICALGITLVSANSSIY